MGPGAAGLACCHGEMFAGFPFRAVWLAALVAVLAAVPAAAQAQAGWWGSRYGCNYVTDPDYLQRRYVPRPYFIDKRTIWSGDAICHLTPVSDGNYGLSGLAGSYDADCKHERNGERQSLSVQIVEHADGELSLLWKLSGASGDTEVTKIGPLRRCAW